MKDLGYVIRLHLDASLRPTLGTVTAYEDEAETYRVTLAPGPFDTWQEALASVEQALDKQLTLW